MNQKLSAITQLRRHGAYALTASLLALSIIAMLFFVAEPPVSQAVNSNSFTVKQAITGDVSFLVQPSNVTLQDSISGVTGGTASGTTNFTVLSNDTDGYTVNIGFADPDGNGIAMMGDNTGTSSIKNYVAGLAAPTYGFTAGSQAEFAYTVYSATDPTRTATNFKNNSSDCGVGTTNGTGLLATSCWKAPSTTATYNIVDTSALAMTGATTTVKFLVSVPSSLGITADTYTATVTLTLTGK